MYKKFAKFIFSIGLAIFLPLCFVACNEKEDKVVNHAVYPADLELVIFEGDEVDLNSFYIDLVYESGKVETIRLRTEDFLNFSTTVAGEHTAFVLLGTTKYQFTYYVYPITLENVRYTGSQLLFYVGESPDFSLVEVLALYSNGDEGRLTLDKFLHTDIDFTLDGQEKQLTFSLGEVTVEIPYTVTCRPLEVGKEYAVRGEYDHCILEFEGEDYKLSFFDENGNLKYPSYPTKDEFNRFTFAKITGKELVYFVAYLSGGVLVVEPIDQTV